MRGDAATDEPSRTSRARRLATPAAICALALGVRLLYLLSTGHDPLTSDASQYQTLATNLVHGLGYAQRYPQLKVHPTAFRPPLYPMLLALFYWVFGPSAGLGRGVNVALGVGVVALTFFTVERHLGRRAAVGASVAVAVMPNLVANDTFTLDEPLALILVLVLVNVLLRRKWAVAGAVTGLLVLTRPSAQYLVIVLAVWVLLRGSWRRALLYVASALVVVSPWLVRNWVQLGSPVVATSNGFNWAAIYSPPAQRAGGFIDPTYDPYFNSMRLDQFNEVLWNSKLQSIGVHTLEQHPTYLFRVIARNGAALFELKPSLGAGAEREDGRSLTIVNATLWIFYLEAVLGIAGLWIRRRHHLIQLLAVQSAYFGLASLLFIAAPRLRAPIDVTLAVGVGCFVDWALERRRLSRGHSPADTVASDATMTASTAHG
jgi:4-amino-4-deoxy-L-arabinose transferase-like glycosyltransferase